MTEAEKAKKHRAKQAWTYWLRGVEEDMDANFGQWYRLFLSVEQKPLAITEKIN